MVIRIGSAFFWFFAGGLVFSTDFKPVPSVFYGSFSRALLGSIPGVFAEFLTLFLPDLFAPVAGKVVSNLAP